MPRPSRWWPGKKRRKKEEEDERFELEEEVECQDLEKERKKRAPRKPKQPKAFPGDVLFIGGVSPDDPVLGPVVIPPPSPENKTGLRLGDGMFDRVYSKMEKLEMHCIARSWGSSRSPTSSDDFQTFFESLDDLRRVKAGDPVFVLAEGIDRPSVPCCCELKDLEEEGLFMEEETVGGISDSRERSSPRNYWLFMRRPVKEWESNVLEQGLLKRLYSRLSKKQAVRFLLGEPSALPSRSLLDHAQELGWEGLL